MELTECILTVMAREGNRVSPWMDGAEIINNIIMAKDK